VELENTPEQNRLLMLAFKAEDMIKRGYEIDVAAEHSQASCDLNKPRFRPRGPGWFMNEPPRSMSGLER